VETALPASLASTSAAAAHGFTTLRGGRLPGGGVRPSTQGSVTRPGLGRGPGLRRDFAGNAGCALLRHRHGAAEVGLDGDDWLGTFRLHIRRRHGQNIPCPASSRCGTVHMPPPCVIGIVLSTRRSIRLRRAESPGAAVAAPLRPGGPIRATQPRSGRAPGTPVIIENVVEQIDTIVRPVRHTGWQTCQPGDREVRVQLPLVLKINGLPPQGALFDRAYAYVRGHY